jgi:hypothetical protein
MVELGIVACVILAAGAARFNWKKWWYRKDINVLAPDKKRKDLYFGFYGCQNEQVAETRGAVNLLMESQWEGTAQTIANIKAADVDVMLDVSPQLFVREATGFVLRSDGFTWDVCAFISESSTRPRRAASPRSTRLPGADGS